jgi:copper(I)-binding protein
MSTRPRTALTTPARVCVAVLLALVLAGCGGESKPTREDVRDKRINDPVRRDSVSARVGDLRLLTIRIERPEGVHATGSNSAMFLTLANSGATDRLVAISSVDARSVVQREGAEAPAPGIDITVPEGDVVSMQSPYGLHLELVDLKRDLGKRTFVPVTFRFADAGEVTVQVFVSGVDRQVVPPSPSASRGG